MRDDSHALTQIPAALRAHFSKHNRHVLLVAGATLFFAIAFWALLYFVIYWLTLIGFTINDPIEARVPPLFLPVFVASGFLLCAIAWIVRRFSPHEVVHDHKSVLVIAADLALAVPRATLDVWSNLSAYQFLNEREMCLAWLLLQRITRERKLPVQNVPQEIPNRAAAQKIVFALQLTDLIDLRKNYDGLFISLHDSHARAVCEPRVRISVPS